MLRDDDRALVAAARHPLGEDARTIRVDSADVDYLLGRVRTDQMAGFLARAVLDGVVELDADAHSSLTQEWHHTLKASVRLEAFAVRTAALLDGAGVAWRLTKGAALAHLDYPDPSLRTFGDVDIVVHPRDWSRAFSLLSVNGYPRRSATLPGSYDDRYGKGATFAAANGLELDLHRRFAVGRFAVRTRMEDLFTRSDTITLAGRGIPTLDTAGRLLHACIHAMLGRGALLRTFRDIAQLLIVTGADWESTFEIARCWRAEAVVAAAIKQTWQRLELTNEHPAHERALATEISTKDARVLEQFPLMPFRKQALTALTRLPPYEIPRYLWALSAGQRRRALTRTP